jgi:hypothetical protein
MHYINNTKILQKNKIFFSKIQIFEAKFTFFFEILKVKFNCIKKLKSKRSYKF